MSEQTVCAHLRITSMQQRDSAATHVCADCGDTLTARQANAERVTSDSITQTLGKAICRALDLNPRRVTSLRLSLEPGFPPLLDVSVAILGEDHAALRVVLEQYEITPIASAPQVAGQKTTGSN